MSKNEWRCFNPKAVYSLSPSVGHVSASLSCAQRKSYQLLWLHGTRAWMTSAGHAFLLILLHLFFYCLFNGAISGWHRGGDSLVVTDWTARCSNPGRAKRLFFFPYRPDRPLGPPSFLFSGHWALSQRHMDRDVKFTAQLHWIPKLRLSGGKPLLPCMH